MKSKRKSDIIMMQIFAQSFWIGDEIMISDEQMHKLVEQMADEMNEVQVDFRCQLTMPYIMKSIDEINKKLSEEQGYEVIEFSKWRIKSPESIVKKLLRRDVEPTFENALNCINDIVGVRIVTFLYEDIYLVVDALKKIEGIHIRNIKDFVKNPKPSGYRSVHVIVDLVLGNDTIGMEIQVRSSAMNYWSVLQHMIFYKSEKTGADMEKIEQELERCSKDIAEIDKRMRNMRDLIDEM